MTDLIRRDWRDWDPFRDLMDLRDEFNRFFGEALPGHQQRKREDSMYVTPRADLMDEGNEIVCRVDLPGIEKDNVNVEVNGNMLTISAQVKEENEEKKENYLRKERRYGKFHRTFEFASELDPDNVKAKLKNGVLEVRIPKTEKETRGVEVEVEE